ncbi:MAG TPA: GNAT family N-acetyltransferase [Candidatus Binatia bacterium]|nr:GNAT family N-acetyltransferase [Candidatus Binatia bacterium]
MPLRIRPAVAADVSALADLVRELNAFHGDPVEHCTAETLLRDGFGQRPAFAVHVAELDGALVGYALYHDAYEPVYAARGVYMSDLMVTAAARGSGAGRALVAAVAAEARRRGASFVGWVSRAWNQDAQAFYRRLGAIEEPTISHAIAFEAFTTLADEAERRQASE